jgi:hypothetical protein
VERELGGIGGAELLKVFDKLPRDFVEYLKERYGGWSLYFFYIPPDAEYEETKRLRAVMEEVGLSLGGLAFPTCRPASPRRWPRRGRTT